jgi:NAD(P)-dependent dehydrogenase (short-subunit alcohol dehydrogenase family)
LDITESVALVTGTNRGIGRHLAEQLVARGAKVYATARRPELVDIPGAEVLQLDITDIASVVAAASVATDVNLLVNNAGIGTRTPLVTGDLETIRLEMETHYFGTLNVVRAFAPVLAGNGGGAILNVLSVLSWFASGAANAYAAAKAAEWSLTNGIRVELAGQGTMVTGVHLSVADTDMMAGYDGPMLHPADVATAALDGIEADQLEVLVDGVSASVKAALAGDLSALYPDVVSTRERSEAR